MYSWHQVWRYACRCYVAIYVYQPSVSQLFVSICYSIMITGMGSRCTVQHAITHNVCGRYMMMVYSTHCASVAADLQVCIILHQLHILQHPMQYLPSSCPRGTMMDTAGLDTIGEIQGPARTQPQSTDLRHHGHALHEIAEQLTIARWLLVQMCNAGRKE